jgi:hypothetical protein
MMLEGRGATASFRREPGPTKKQKKEIEAVGDDDGSRY